MTVEQNNFVNSLFGEVGEALLQFAYRFTGEEAMAEDIAQQTFFLACLKAEALREHPNPRGWLFVTARYLIKRELAGAQYKPTADIENFNLLSSPEGNGSMAEHLPEGLNEEERSLLLEHLEYGFSLAEMAEKRGITAEACRRRYSRVRAKCRELMIKEQEELEKI